LTVGDEAAGEFEECLVHVGPPFPADTQAAEAVPLAGVERTLGTLDLYRAAPGSLSGGHVRTALLVADAVTLAVLALDHASPAPKES
jgi:hypothetical protein